MEHFGDDVAARVASFNEFAPGVPASDGVCLALLDVLEKQYRHTTDGFAVESPWVAHPACSSGSLLTTELKLNISDAYFVEIEKSMEGNNFDRPVVLAVFRAVANPGPGIAPHFQEDFTPAGLRKLIANVKAHAEDLKKRGLCPTCPGVHKCLRCPQAEYCEVCCLTLACGGRLA